VIGFLPLIVDQGVSGVGLPLVSIFIM